MEWLKGSITSSRGQLIAEWVCFFLLGIQVAIAIAEEKQERKARKERKEREARWEAERNSSEFKKYCKEIEESEEEA